MRPLSLLVLPLILGLTTPALARHHDDDDDWNGRGGYEQRGDRHGDWDRGEHRGWDRGDRGRDWDHGRRDNWRGDWRGPPVVRYSRPRVIIIAPPQREYIRSYYRRNPCDWDRGFGWRPVIGSRVPYGIPCRPVPYDLARELPEYPGYGNYVIGRDVVLISLATGIIVDVFFDAF